MVRVLSTSKEWEWELGPMLSSPYFSLESLSNKEWSLRGPRARQYFEGGERESSKNMQ